jgi:hypothetical protein
MEERIPEEEETIAARRAERLAKKARRLRFLRVRKAWWNNAISEAVALVVLFLLNLYLIFPFFGTPAIETSFSGPVIPLLARMFELTGLNFSHALQIVYIFFFLLFPYSLYLFIRKIGVRKSVAFLAVLFASLPFYPFALSRFNSAFNVTDGPHAASLTLMPLALYGLIIFIKDGGISNLLLASIFFALVALTSPFGFSILIALSFITTFSEMLLGSGRLKFFRLLVILLVAFGLSSFWYNPQFSFVMFFGPIGEGIRQTIVRLVPISFFVIPVLAAFGFLLFDRKPDLQPVFLASFYTIAFAMVILVRGGLFPSHPSRYIPEFGMSLAFLFSIGVVKVTDRLRFSKTKNGYNFKLIANVIVLLIVAVSVLAIILGRGNLAHTQVDVLGLWTGLERGEIWLARDGVGEVSEIVGFMITGGTVLSLPYLWLRAKKS